MNNEKKALNYLLATSEIVESGRREWRGPLTRDRYGQIGVDWILKTWGIKGAHRLMVRLAHGHEFAGRSEQVMHLCHNRRCIHPDHLQLGTATENMAAAKLRGSQFGTSVLTTEQVLLIRALRSLCAAARWIADRSSISEAHVYKIDSRKSWRDTDHESEDSRVEMEDAARAMIAEAKALGEMVARKAVL